MIDSRSISVTKGLAARTIRKLLRHPFFTFRPLLMPLLFFVAFTGALSAFTKTKGFTYYQYTAFEIVVILYMAAVMTGIFTGFDIAGDFASGLGNRLMLASPRRMAIIAGYLVVSFGRAVLSIVAVFALGLVLGLTVRGNALDVAGIVAFALVLNIAVTLYGAGIALRFQSAASGTLIFIPTYIAMFITPVFVPAEQLTSWLKVAAPLNPLTPILEAGRGLMAGGSTELALACATAGGLLLASVIFAVTGMRKAERGPSAKVKRSRGPAARRAARSTP